MANILKDSLVSDKIRELEKRTGMRIIVSNGRAAISGILNGTTAARSVLTVFLKEPRVARDGDSESQEIIDNISTAVAKDPRLKAIGDIHLDLPSKMGFSATTEDGSQRIDF